MGQAETIETPYLYYRSSDKNESAGDEIRVEEKAYLLEEDNPEVTEYYYFEEHHPKDYPIRTNDYQYTSWSEWSRRQEEGKEEEQRTIYSYQRLKKIKTLQFQVSSSLGFLSLKINGKECLKKESFLFYPKETFEITLEESLYPEEIKLEMTVYRLSNDPSAQINITDPKKEYVEKTIKINEPGISLICEKGIHLLKKLLLENKVQTTTDLKDLFYIKIKKQEQEYRYREKKYRFQKEPKQIKSKGKEKEGYHLVGGEVKYHYYRKEKIELYDEIVLDGYIELNQIVKRTTFPLKDLKIASSSSCGKTILTFTYQDFSFKREAYINCEEEHVD